MQCVCVWAGHIDRAGGACVYRCVLVDKERIRGEGGCEGGGGRGGC
jgi:hypothetical protein